MEFEDYWFLDETITKIAEDVQRRLKFHALDLPPILYRQRYDDGSEKWRTIGVQKPIHQIFDYIAVEGCIDMFMAKIEHSDSEKFSDKQHVAKIKHHAEVIISSHDKMVAENKKRRKNEYENSKSALASYAGTCVTQPNFRWNSGSVDQEEHSAGYCPF